MSFQIEKGKDILSSAILYDQQKTQAMSSESFAQLIMA